MSLLSEEALVVCAPAPNSQRRKFHSQFSKQVCIILPCHTLLDLLLALGSDVGGTWHHNTYPGCACDVWTTLYQFTFFPNPDWSRFVAPATEIKKYLETFTRNYDLYPHIQFNTKVMSATWRQEEGVWKVTSQ